MPQPVVGCDLSHGFIDLCRLPSAKVERIANTPEDISAFLDTLDRDVLVMFEATSGCDGHLIAALVEHAVPLARQSLSGPRVRQSHGRPGLN